MTFPNPNETSPCYCLHCLTVVGERDPECTGCRRSFAGAGRFDRMSGEPPRAPRTPTPSYSLPV